MRVKPYTARGIKRIPCFRCGRPSAHEWSICADNNRRRTVCVECDIGLNRAALEYMRDPDVEEKMRLYMIKQGVVNEEES